MKHIIQKLKIYLKPFLNWRFLVSFSIPYGLINGWSWIGIYLIPFTGMTTYAKICIAWQTFLWQPFCIEQLVTVPMAIWIHSKLFKNDEKTKKYLDEMYAEAKEDFKHLKFKIKYLYLNVR